MNQCPDKHLSDGMRGLRIFTYIGVQDDSALCRVVAFPNVLRDASLERLELVVGSRPASRHGDARLSA